MKVGRRLVTVAPNHGATSFGGARTHTAPESTNPASQVITQRPALHAAIEFAGALHNIPQPPQCALLTLVSVSQPFIALPSQLANPALHAAPQTPNVHDAAPFAGTGHTVPHVPQLTGLVFVLTSQPFAKLLSQLPKPALHVPEHKLIAQADKPFAIAGHTRAHAPQLLRLVLRSTSQPSTLLRLQLPKPALHCSEQPPPAQVAAALAAAPHTRPQPPQFATLVRVSVSHPFITLPSQSPDGATHAMPHTLLMQAGDAPITPGQTLPHIPQ